MRRNYEMMLWRQGVYQVSMDGQLVLLYPNVSSITTGASPEKSRQLAEPNDTVADGIADMH